MAGGRRKGAGRPRKGKFKRIRTTVSIESETLSKLKYEALRREKSMGDIINEYLIAATADFEVPESTPDYDKMLLDLEQIDVEISSDI